MRTPTVTTASHRPAADARVHTTTVTRSRLQASPSRILGLLCAALCCLLLVGVAECSDEADRPCVETPEAEAGVATFLIKASPPAEDADDVIALAVLRERREPGQALILGGMTNRVERKLQYAYPLALQRVREVDTCRDLFAKLGADGVATLDATLYRPAESERELEICSFTSALAFTGIGRSHTRLCDSFGGQARQTAAMILIHEALHSAGMSERPHDPTALNSVQINRLVRTSCNL